ncbi:nitronate monooxygenase [Bacillus atrophaeus]|nr:nitronate monooxygenase [Bacillus atrophaeus]MEC2395441.1 nitronate monooxygenase [Bacillus atrophaeus]MED4435348.1 nitronate monooxygenase [Bacillus atrophaeus]MED4566127.1 nitronate monooxygenase [Bacillus atrophaeus]MED4574444.1 nitronate monooxygenase [Bacillus atrophaeus]
MSAFHFAKVLREHNPSFKQPMRWITDANMVAAVSNAGGMGVLGPNAGAKSTSSRSTCL